MLDNERAVIGDNSPPPYDLSEVAEFETNVEEFMRVSQQWLSLDKVETEEHASQMTDQISGLRGLYKKIDTARKAAKKPHDDAGKAVQSAFTPMLTKIQKAADALKPKLAVYASAKAEAEAKIKAEAEEAARKEAEAAQAALEKAQASNDIAATVDAEAQAKAAEEAQKAAAKPAKSNIKSASGGGRTMSIRKTKTVEITNINVLFMHYRDHPDVHATLSRLATADVRASGYDEGTAIPGIDVKITETIA